MPIKDPLKRREYQRELMRKRRNSGLTDKNVSPVLDLKENVSPVSPQMLDPGLTVSPNQEKLDPETLIKGRRRHEGPELGWMVDCEIAEFSKLANLEQVETHQPDTIIYEHTNFVRVKGKDMTSLFKLLGAVEVLPYLFAFVKQIYQVPVNQVKSLKDKLLKGTKTIAGLEYHQGRAEVYKEKGLFHIYLTERKTGKTFSKILELFSRKARGGRAKTVSEIVYEEAIPIDQEFLGKEQFNFRDLVDSLKRKDKPLKITFLANPYSWSSWFLGVFEEEGGLWGAKKHAEELLATKDKAGVKV
ncbi:3536_t:CDS:2 [Scutellospora calospora]|uniref:3536_t:CDS:1 n=1 Tax=Scutellospora calospora TaxID=85575 RepID=A0ACA9LA62_9GLOM|nr:3536_t:CDS:2 [Scutellospora calospora]